MATCFATNSLHFVLKLIVVVFTVFFLDRFPSFDRKQHLRNCGEKTNTKGQAFIYIVSDVRVFFNIFRHPFVALRV